MAKKKKKENKIKKIGIFLSVTALILLVGGIFFIFGTRGGSAHDIELEIETPDEIRKGVPVELEVNINNRTNEALTNSELTLRLQEGFINLDFEGDESVFRANLNTIGEGTLTKETVRVLPVGSVSSDYEITGSLDYSIGSASFEKEITEEIKIGEQPIEVSIQRPDQILGGSSFETTVLYENTTDFDFPSLSLQVNYPSNFNFISASLDPTSLNNQWDLGALRSGSEGEIDIRGNIENGDSGSLDMEAVVSAEFLNQSYEIARTSTDVSPSESPLDVDVAVSGAPKAGSRLTYNISYENKSGVVLRNITISSELAGKMFDLYTIESDGDVDRPNNQIIWDSGSVSELAVLEPGQEGSVSFSIDLKEDYPLRRLSDKNFELVVNTQIQSPTVPYYIEADRTSASEETKMKVEGKTTVEAKGFYRDAGSGFVNEGSFPPAVGETTEFTIHWIVKNFATDVRDVYMEAELPDGVEWTGQVKSDTDSVPIYDKENSSIVWEIDDISATRGVISRPIEAVFQVELDPRPQFQGSYHPLILETSLEAIDSFTGKTITHSSGVVNTSLSDDPTTDASDGLVQ